jgi:hypothetical protein
VIGFEAAKAQLLEDAQLLARGELDTLPMGYLICGPVGTGKSFPLLHGEGNRHSVVMLKNFRSKLRGRNGRQSRARLRRAARDGSDHGSSSTKRTRCSAIAALMATAALEAECSVCSRRRWATRAIADDWCGCC